tara:strand:+ start:2111 stop:3352 length:1242 start_codon:yes stop_codon:yes gene_type:complete
MSLVYNFLIAFFEKLLSFFSIFSERVHKFLKPRYESFSTLNEKIKPFENYIWIHVASLGEYEQALPIIKEIKKSFVNYKTVLSFFSNSGFEIIKDRSICDLTILLPLDTAKNAKAFLEIINPKMVFFVKYEFWPNYLKYIEERKIQTFLIVGVFRNNHWFFKYYGKWFRKRLKAFSHFFVIDENSMNILKKNGFKNSSVIGDSRFERVMDIKKNMNKVKYIEQFISSRICIVAGSTWGEDEKLFINFINNKDFDNICFIIVPHQIHLKSIESMKNSIKAKSSIMSQYPDVVGEKPKVMIVDSIGVLAKIYSYADIAYVGGGMGTTGLHNTLEPAVFKIPVIIGKNYDKFDEVKKLINLGGIISVDSQKSFDKNLIELINSKDKRSEIGEINYNFIKNNLGASKKVLESIKKIK